MGKKTLDSASTQADSLPFGEVLSRLSATVERLEKGDLPLEESLSLFEEGVRLSRLGARRLDEAERRVEELLTTDDGAELRPLNKEPE